MLADAAAADQVDDREQDDRTDQRIDESRHGDDLVDPASEQEGSDHRTDDPDNDVQQDALLAIRAHKHACKPADNTADHEPNNDTHLFPPLLPALPGLGQERLTTASICSAGVSLGQKRRPRIHGAGYGGAGDQLKFAGYSVFLLTLVEG